MFEIPCVAMAQSLDEVGPLAAAGADFVAVGDFIWNDPRGAAAALAAAAASLPSPEPCRMSGEASDAGGHRCIALSAATPQPRRPPSRRPRLRAPKPAATAAAPRA